MKKPLRRSLYRRATEACIAAAILTAFPFGVSSSQPAQSGSPEAFADQFVSAVTSRDAERRTEVLHPLTRACINAKTQPYYDWIFTRQARLVKGSYKVAATPVSTSAALPADGNSSYPIRPTHQLQIDFGSAANAATVPLFIAHDGARWREVLPCPRGDVIAQAEANRNAQQQQDRKVAQLAGAISANLRQEIVSLLKEGRKVEAIKRYAAVSGQDISTAKGVVESLQP